MNKNIIEQWKKDEQAHFEGWDFSYLQDRMIEEKPDWDYLSQARQLVYKAESILDVATGGGEKLSKLAPFNERKMVATEGYGPNVKIAKDNLASFGVDVVFIDETEALPFGDESFDLILNRHGGLNVREINRVLQNGGIFFTQQVAGDNLSDLLFFFEEKPTHSENTLSHVKRKLSEAGMSIEEAREWEGKTSFKDVGALVYYLKFVPWVVKDFSVATHLPYLKKIQDKLEAEGSLTFTSKRFLVKAKKS
ncbi:MAG: methyltransferase domain-containing protein [Candidatus Campbellbacteria bacterium]|nr:methyltransferase domain-containing protein [Candidatus Campbellbacteria bacterium]